MSDDVMAQARELLATVVGDQPLPWTLWTSCSFRRIGCDATRGDGDVLHALNHRSDGHPDLSMSERRLGALVDLLNLLPAALSRSDEAVRAAAIREAAEVSDKYQAYCARQAERSPGEWQSSAHTCGMVGRAILALLKQPEPRG